MPEKNRRRGEVNAREPGSNYFVCAGRLDLMNLRWRKIEGPGNRAFACFIWRPGVDRAPAKFSGGLTDLAETIGREMARNGFEPGEAFWERNGQALVIPVVNMTQVAMLKGIEEGTRAVVRKRKAHR